MSLSAAFLALSLLVLGLGTNIKMPLVVLAGQLGSAAFGVLVGLHTIFYLARSGKPVAHLPSGRFTNFELSNRGCGCSDENKK